MSYTSEPKFLETSHETFTLYFVHLFSLHPTTLTIYSNMSKLCGRIIGRIEAGDRPVNIARHFCIHRTTVCKVKKLYQAVPKATVIAACKDMSRNCVGKCCAVFLKQVQVCIDGDGGVCEKNQLKTFCSTKLHVIKSDQHP